MLMCSTTPLTTLYRVSLSGAQVQNPFLLRGEIESTFDRVFHNGNGTSSPRDHFRAFMILATGSVTLYRSGRHSHHPFGYYLAAMEFFDVDFLAYEISAIQDLLLICRFGIYHHIGPLCPICQAHALLADLVPQALRFGTSCNSAFVCVSSKGCISLPGSKYHCCRNSCSGGFSGNAT